MILSFLLEIFILPQSPKKGFLENACMSVVGSSILPYVEYFGIFTLFVSNMYFVSKYTLKTFFLIYPQIICILNKNLPKNKF